MWTRRTYLGGGGSLLSTTLGGCSIRDFGANGFTQADETYSRGAICVEPGGERDGLPYSWHEPRTSFEHPLLTGGLGDESTAQDEADRFFLITDEEDSRLDLDLLHDERTRYTDEDRAFFDETDLERSVLLAYEGVVEGDQEFDVTATVREDDGTIATFACLWGDPRPGSDVVYGDVAVRPMTVFVRVGVSHRPDVASLTVARSRVPTDGDPREIEEYIAEAGSE